MNTIRQKLFVSRFLRYVAWLAIGGFASLASAETSPAFEIVPAIAGPGVQRQISVMFPILEGCPPTVRVVNSVDTPRKRVLVISVDLTQGSIVCDVVVIKKLTVNYTPQEEGDLRVAVVTNQGSYFGETVLRTRADVSKRSQYDLTGMWYDPSTNGSGVTFVHGATGNDAVFGTWYVYDNAGNPRWYTIQNVQWNTGGMDAQGQLYETRANSIVCVPPYTGCPVALALASAAGVVSIVMQGPNSARITAVSAGGTMTSNLIRSIF